MRRLDSISRLLAPRCCSPLRTSASPRGFFCTGPARLCLSSSRAEAPRCTRARIHLGPLLMLQRARDELFGASRSDDSLVRYIHCVCVYICGPSYGMAVYTDIQPRGGSPRDLELRSNGRLFFLSHVLLEINELKL